MSFDGSLGSLEPGAGSRGGCLHMVRGRSRFGKFLLKYLQGKYPLKARMDNGYHVDS